MKSPTCNVVVQYTLCCTDDIVLQFSTVNIIFTDFFSFFRTPKNIYVIYAENTDGIKA